MNDHNCNAGLDEAILGSMNSCGDPEQDSKKIADLLKYGAHSLVNHLLSCRHVKACSKVHLARDSRLFSPAARWHGLRDLLCLCLSAVCMHCTDGEWLHLCVATSVD